MSHSTQVAATRAITVPFHGADLYVVEHNGQPYTPMKPIVEGMGIDWKGQHAKLAANEARWGMEEISIPTAGGMQVMACIALRKLFGWLAGIHVGKIKKEIRPTVLTYQNECDDVLWQYWNEGIAINPRAAYSVNPGDVLTKQEADTLRQMVEGMAKKLSPDPKVQGKYILQAWSKLKSHFHVSYRQIPRQELAEAVSIINRHAVEWELVDETPPAAGRADFHPFERQALRSAQANAVAYMRDWREQHAQGKDDPVEMPAIPADVLAGLVAEAMMNQRWLVAYNDSRGALVAQPVGQDEFVLSWPALVRGIETGDCSRSSIDLLAMASACTRRVQDAPRADLSALLDQPASAGFLLCHAPQDGRSLTRTRTLQGGQRKSPPKRAPEQGQHCRSSPKI